MNTDPAVKVARQKLSVLELAQTLGSVSQACRQRGISRTSFYEYKKRFEERGLEGLKDLPPIVKSHPFTTPPETVERIVTLSLENPSRGCNFISDLLCQEGILVSYPTVQNILNKQGLRGRYDRWLRLEQLADVGQLEPTETQLKFLIQENPIWRERRHVESRRPGELLCQDTSAVGKWEEGFLRLHAVVDTFSSYGFAFLYPSKQPEAAVAVLHNEVLPFYAEQGLAVEAILTDNGTEFCGTPEHPYQLYLALNDIEHRRTQVKHPHTNGFVERFIRTVKEEFFRSRVSRLQFTTLDELQAALDDWLVYYNTQRPHQGYRNMGRRPRETIDAFKAGTLQQGKRNARTVKNEA
ncbi:MAG: IS481 family transposase [Candidatus Promineofilum sp.]|nr:IS481 family transposase [Promineifilum sp.]